MKLFFSIIFFLYTSYIIIAQVNNRCGTEETENVRAKKNHGTEKKEQFEKWLSNKINSLKRFSTFSRTAEPVYIIPVVVHVIHNGEAIGLGTNISDARIISQIKVLNEDYSRTNADTSSTRPIFKPVAANCNIQFQLAQTDPDGFPTSGIVRIKGSKKNWNEVTDNELLKSQSYWNSSQYLNIWVCNFSSNSLLGYSQYPESSLPGLQETENKNVLTDGVVIKYNAFGTFNSTSPFNLGRTTTHEVGHYLGLRHTWGDVDSCKGTDYCDDTPNLPGSSDGCPLSKKSCDKNTLAMIENYMDYTNDACMNLFTNDQKARMRIVLENSPRRLSLLTSPGLQPPNLTANDAGIKYVISPGNLNYCQPQIPIKFVLKNYGNNNLLSATIGYSIDNDAASTFNWSGNLAPSATDTITLGSPAFSLGEHTFRIYSTLPNNQTDSKTYNDTLTLSFTIIKYSTLPFLENFNNGTFPPSGWEISNPDLQTTWTDTLALGTLSTNNLAAYINFYNYDNIRGAEQDVLFSSNYDFSKTTFATLQFNLSYIQYLYSDKTKSNDGLAVLISTDCGNTYNDVLFEKYGSDLATSQADSTEWSPKGLSDWRAEQIDLGSYIGKPNVSFAFVGVNDYGNNLYLDDVQVLLVTGTEIPIENPSIINIFPNPSNGDFNISIDLKLSQNVEIQINDALGKNVYSQSLKNINNYNLNCRGISLMPGMYFVTVKGKNFQKIGKVVIN